MCVSLSEKSTIARDFKRKLMAYFAKMKPEGFMKIDFMEFEGIDDKGKMARYFIKNICLITN